MAKTEKITQEKIILAFLESCFEKNAGGTSLSDVAGRLDIKKASLYNHYESRDAMIEDCIRWCNDYIQRIFFIPNDIETISKKYSAESVLKGLVNRWFKMNEKEPLVQIYSFIESEKYISTQAAKVSESKNEKLRAQTKTALNCLSSSSKISTISEDKAEYLSKLFVNMLNSELDTFIVKKKIDIRSNPVSDESSLFALPQTNSNFEEIDKLVESFCGLLK